MNINNIYYIIAIITISLFVIWLLTNLLNLQNTVIEGLKNNKTNETTKDIEKILSEVNTLNEEELQVLKIDENFDTYIDLLKSLRENTKLHFLKGLSENTDKLLNEKNPQHLYLSSSSCSEAIENLDKMIKFLNE